VEMSHFSAIVRICSGVGVTPSSDNETGMSME